MIFNFFSTKKAGNSFGEVFLVLKKQETLKFFNIIALKKSARTCAKIFSAKKRRPSFFRHKKNCDKNDFFMLNLSFLCYNIVL